jgi:hypothetical protein
VATSLPDYGIAIFAGGFGASSFDAFGVLHSESTLISHSCAGGCNVVDIYNATNGKWSTAVLSCNRCQPAATSLPNHGIAIIAGCSGPSNVVDIYNANTNIWTTANMSVPRYALTATSLPHYGLAMIAGGTGALYVYNASSFINGREKRLLVRELQLLFI